MTENVLSRNAGDSCPERWGLQVPMLEPGDRQRTFELCLCGAALGVSQPSISYWIGEDGQGLIDKEFVPEQVMKRPFRCLLRRYEKVKSASGLWTMALLQICRIVAVNKADG